MKFKYMRVVDYLHKIGVWRQRNRRLSLSAGNYYRRMRYWQMKYEQEHERCQALLARGKA